MYFVKGKYFVWSLFFVLLIFIVSYIFIYNYLVNKTLLKTQYDYHYQEFLLKSTKEYERIIIDGGSNSNHSINSQMLEKEFNKIVINISDNGVIPLFFKLHRLKKNSKSGDIILLPLGYIYYFSTDNNNKIFYDGLFGYFNSYYHGLDFVEKGKLIFQTPASSILKAITTQSNEMQNSLDFVEKFNFGERGDFKFRTKSQPDFFTQAKSCEEYIFLHKVIPDINERLKYDNYDFILSSNFKRNISLMKEIEKENGVKFILTYPAVTGDNCYSGKYKEKFIEFDEELKEFLSKNDIPIIGSYQDSYFPKKYMNDTYYHVLPEARDIRTKKLIENIKNSNYYSLFNNSSKDKVEAKMDISNFINSIQSISFDKEYSFSSNVNNIDIKLLRGWYQKETIGVWSKRERSRVIFKIDKNKIEKDLILKLKSNIFGDKDKSDIFINEKYLGTYLLDGVNNIKINKSFIDRNFITIEFRNKNIKSPKELGISEDNRALKLLLKSIEVTTI